MTWFPSLQRSTPQTLDTTQESIDVTIQLMVPLGPRLRLGPQALEAPLPDLALGPKLFFQRFGKQIFPSVCAQAERLCKYSKIV